MTECWKYFFHSEVRNLRSGINNQKFVQTTADIKNCAHFHILNIPSKHHILSLMGLGIRTKNTKRDIKLNSREIWKMSQTHFYRFRFLLTSCAFFLHFSFASFKFKSTFVILKKIKLRKAFRLKYDSLSASNVKLSCFSLIFTNLIFS